MVATLKILACPKCVAAISTRAHGISVSIVCQSCGAVSEPWDAGSLRFVRESSERISEDTLPFRLGARAVFEGVQWEVIGFMRRTDILWMFSWDEYLLFNPYEGFRFLIDSDGHFALAKQLSSVPDIPTNQSGRKVQIEGIDFRLFHKGTSEVTAVLGEFYWRVGVGDCAAYADYIAPPRGFSIEQPESSGTEQQQDSEQNYSIASYLSHKEIAEAFGIAPNKLALASREPFPYEPNPYRSLARKLWILCAVFSFLVVGLQSFFISHCDSYKVFDSVRTFAPIERWQEILLGEFSLPQSLQNMEVRSFSEVSNSWIEVDYDIEAINGGESISVSQAIEYYFGRDSDGTSWREGGKSTYTLGAPLSGQRYKLFATVDAQAFSVGAPISIRTTIKVDVPVWASFWLSWLIILIPPIVTSFRSLLFERFRWRTSDYSPYSSE